MNKSEAHYLDFYFICVFYTEHISSSSMRRNIGMNIVRWAREQCKIHMNEYSCRWTQFIFLLFYMASRHRNVWIVSVICSFVILSCTMYANAQYFSVHSPRVNEFTSSLLLEYGTYNLNVFAVLLETERNNEGKKHKTTTAKKKTTTTTKKKATAETQN